MILFFTSRMWLYDDNPIRQTRFNHEIDTLQQTKLKLLDWRYNEKENFMEVVINKKFVGSDSIIPSYEFEAREIEMNDLLDVNIVYEDDDMLVVHLKDVPEKFKFIDLTVIETRDKEVVRVELEDQQIDNEDLEYLSEDDLIDSNEVILTGDYREIKVDNTLTMKSGNEYTAGSIRNEINITKKEMKNIKEKKIPLEDRFIVEEEKKIASLEKELTYLSGEEKEDAEQIIKTYKDNIKASFSKKDEHKESLKQLESKLEGLEDKLKYIINDGEEPSDKEVESKKDDESKSLEEEKKDGTQKETKKNNSSKEKEKKGNKKKDLVKNND